jgi:hypothetical protein
LARKGLTLLNGVPSGKLNRVKMDVADQFQEVRILFIDDGSVAVLEEVAGAFVAFVEGDGVTGHEFSHDLAERGRASAQRSEVGGRTSAVQ